jgi:hypothetical protein
MKLKQGRFYKYNGGGGRGQLVEGGDSGGVVVRGDEGGLRFLRILVS